MSQSIKEKNIFANYLKVVAPAMIEYENITNAFPTGVLNEVRDVFFHLAKTSTLSDEELREREISKADRHMTRAMRDCYKYICAALENTYQNYQKKFTALLKNIKTEEEKQKALLIEETHIQAMKNLTSARTMEIDPLSDDKDEEIFKAYDKALSTYRLLMKQIESFFSKQ